MTKQVLVDDEAYQLLERTAEKWGFGPEALGNAALLAGLGALSIIWAVDLQTAKVASDRLCAVLDTGALGVGPRPSVQDH